MRARGLRVGVMKPFDTVESHDGRALALAVGSPFPMDVISADTAAAIQRYFDQIASKSDVVIVEASNAIDFANLAAQLDLEIILVVGNRTGCVHAMTCILESCEKRNLKVAGCILCDCEVDLHVDALDTPPGVPYLGRMRHREPLAKSIVEQLL